MSVDTPSRRFSAINGSAPWRGLSVLPSGAVPRSERSALAWLYSGLNFGPTYTVTALAGSFAMSGTAAILTATTHINTAQRRFAAVNVSAPWRGLAVFPTGAIGRPARSALAWLYVPVVSTGPTYTLSALSGSYFWDGEPAFSDFEVSAITGSFAMTANSASLIATRTLYATSGAFAMTGNSANLVKPSTRTLFATTGAFAMTGNSANLDRSRLLTAQAGTFAMTAPRAGLIWSRTLVKPPVTKWGRRHHHQDDEELQLAALVAQHLLNQGH